MEPYKNVPIERWKEVTKNLVEQHPLYNIIVDLCQKSWASILNGKINTYLNMYISEMSLSPQALGALLHDVIPEYISKMLMDSEKAKEKKKMWFASIMRIFLSR